MKLTKILIGCTAAIAAGVVAVACSSSSGGGGGATLDPGSYQFKSGTGAVSGDTCWTPGGSDESLIKAGISAAPFTITCGGGTSSCTSSFNLVFPAPISTFLPPLPGTISGVNMTMSGTGKYTLNSACTLGFSANATGTLTATDQFDANIPVTIMVVPSSATNTRTNCKAFEGTKLGGQITFPTLTNTSSGSCGVTVTGHACIAPGGTISC